MIAVAYVVGFAVLLAVLGWHPHLQRPPHLQANTPVPPAVVRSSLKLGGVEDGSANGRIIHGFSEIDFEEIARTERFLQIGNRKSQI